MNSETAKSIIEEQDKLSHWENKPVIQHGSVDIDLCQACGDNARTPDNAPNQTSLYPKGARYQFDTTKFNGESAFPELKKLIVGCCPGCTLYLQGEKIPSKDHKVLTWVLKCNRYPVEKQTKPSLFRKGYFTKDNVRDESYKQRSSKKKTAFQRMKNPKMRSKARKKKTKKGSSGRLEVSDNRGKASLKRYVTCSYAHSSFDTTSLFSINLNISSVHPSRLVRYDVPNHKGPNHVRSAAI